MPAISWFASFGDSSSDHLCLLVVYLNFLVLNQKTPLLLLEFLQAAGTATATQQIVVLSRNKTKLPSLLLLVDFCCVVLPFFGTGLLIFLEAAEAPVLLCRILLLLLVVELDCQIELQCHLILNGGRAVGGVYAFLLILVVAAVASSILASIDCVNHFA